ISTADNCLSTALLIFFARPQKNPLSGGLFRLEGVDLSGVYEFSRSKGDYGQSYRSANEPFGLGRKALGNDGSKIG
ncbi:hypothetical protein ACDH60_26160, partial [Pseudomonas ficuserectae]